MKKISMIKALEGKKVSTNNLKLSDIENEPVLVTDAEIMKGDLGASASFTAVRADGTNIKVVTYSWPIIDTLQSVKSLEAFPVACQFVMIRGKWDITDIEHPEIFDKFVTVSDTTGEKK